MCMESMHGNLFYGIHAWKFVQCSDSIGGKKYILLDIFTFSCMESMRGKAGIPCAVIGSTDGIHARIFVQCRDSLCRNWFHRWNPCTEIGSIQEFLVL